MKMNTGSHRFVSSAVLCFALPALGFSGPFAGDVEIGEGLSQIQAGAKHLAAKVAESNKETAALDNAVELLYPLIVEEIQMHVGKRSYFLDQEGRTVVSLNETGEAKLMYKEFGKIIAALSAQKDKRQSLRKEALNELQQMEILEGAASPEAKKKLADVEKEIQALDRKLKGPQIKRAAIAQVLRSRYSQNNPDALQDGIDYPQEDRPPHKALLGTWQQASHPGLTALIQENDGSDIFLVSDGSGSRGTISPDGKTITNVASGDTGKIVNNNRIEWSNGAVWTR